VHLVAHAAAFAITAYSLAQIIRGGAVVNFIAWFVGAAVLHDFLFFPLYSGLDRLARHRKRRGAPAPGVPVINHVRVPALISGLLLLVYLPLILDLGDRTYYSASGHHIGGYARNWLLITAVLFTASAVVYAIRVRGHWRGKR
jgi:hypothetical protein